jgi:Ca2+-binding EF-hand superfamily protein
MKQIIAKSSLILICGLAFVALPQALAEHSVEHTADAMFKAADTNNDSKLSRAENAAHGKKLFTDTDTNRDSTVTLVEMTAAHAKMKADMKGKDGLPQATDNDATAEMSPAAMIKMHDQNGDGQLTAAEQTAGCEAMFKKMDANNDGSLSKDECKEGHKQMKSAS